ncbi:hypothetical protein DMC14_001320 [Metamycoplasma phocicerebrale]|uniref:TNase-like domain-containing protein n=1 Tax=Metamycoplasma phocicerebrale TaxID=142649 RepID=A0A3Q9V8F0_9BACT|nr:hypothetical protein [Metamycoplasma phocicerebrale]AZZ65429.1 hypothetical protein DMC14_001320 [Metamycoplasma phocicerebrale]
MNKKNKFLNLILGAPLVAFPIVAISCTNYKDLKLNKTYSIDIKDIDNVGTMFDRNIKYSEYNKITGEETEKTTTLWEYFSLVEGNIAKVSDGDTINIKVTKGSPNGIIKIGQLIKIRIPLIDTLEENTEDVTEREKNLAHLDSEYARSILPIGSKVRLISDDGWINKSYDRSVGYLFYGDGYKKNFSISMLANGWTLPRFNERVLKSFMFEYNKKDKSLVSDYLLPFVAHAFNEGFINKKGFYNSNGVNIKLNGKKTNIKFKNPQALSKEYLSHGETLILDGYRIMYPSYISRSYWNPKMNIYEFLKNNQQTKTK